MAAKVAAWRKHNFGGSGSGSALGSTVATQHLQRQRGIGGGGVSGGSAAGSTAEAGEGRDVLARKNLQKSQHIEESYFVMSHEYLPILY